MNKLVAIDVEKQRKAQKRVDAERLAIVNASVRRIDQLILGESDGSIEMTDKLTQVAAIYLLQSACSQVDLSICQHRPFIEEVRDIEIHAVIDPEVPEVIDDWIRMQLAMHFVEKAAASFSNRLREYDRNN